MGQQEKLSLPFSDKNHFTFTIFQGLPNWTH